MGFSINIDTGGTFTDGFLWGEPGARAVKVRTTPHDLTVCFHDLIKAGAAAYGLSVDNLLYDTDVIRFSSTIGTNTIIQRDGTKMGLLVSAGHRALAPTEGDKPLVSPDMVEEVDEAMDESGKSIRAPSPARVLEAAQALIDRGARCLVVAFANSERNPEHEQRVRDIVKKEYPRDYLGSIPVFLASSISSRPGERQRINAAAINAYTHDKLVRLLYKAEEELRQNHFRRALLIVHNSGAVGRVAKTRAINTYNSGPTAGLYGARMIGALYGERDLVSVDMGGTSFDIGTVVAGVEGYTLEPDIEGFACNLPMSAIKALGMGGGSIVRVVDGKLQVGPDSAGGVPGPVCFGLGGTDPTVTDANLVLGILDPEYFLGGTMRLDVKLARNVIERKVATPLGISVDEAAVRIRAQANHVMASGVVEARQAFGKREPLLVAYGGGGALHACDIATNAALDRVIIPRYSAVSSAFSLSLMDVGHLYQRPLHLPLADCAQSAELGEALARMREEAVRDLRGEGFGVDQATFSAQLFVGKRSGGAQAMLRAPADFHDDASRVKSLVDDAKRALGATKDADVMLESVALMTQAPVPHFDFEAQAEASGTPSSHKETRRKGIRPVLFDAAKGPHEVPVFDRAQLAREQSLAGPAIIESEQTTLLVPVGWRCTVDRYDNILLEAVQHEG